MAKKIQRQFRAGAEYRIEGVSERIRKLRYVGKGKIEKREILFFKPVRKAKKRRS